MILAQQDDFQIVVNSQDSFLGRIFEKESVFFKRK